MPARAPLWAPPLPAGGDPLVPPPLGCPWRLPGRRRLPYLSVMLKCFVWKGCGSIMNAVEVSNLFKI